MQTALKPRKEPRQARSRQTNEVILEAAARVLAREGVAGFNTNRVAEVAGVSVGSLYQYYPNKAALLFKLHERETFENWERLQGILGDRRRSPRERVRRTIVAFFESEAEELALRGALQGAEAYFRSTPEFAELEAMALARLREFLREVLGPGARDLAFKARLLRTVVTSVAENVTDEDLEPAEVRKWARTCATMLCDHLGIPDD